MRYGLENGLLPQMSVPFGSEASTMPTLWLQGPASALSALTRTCLNMVSISTALLTSLARSEVEASYLSKQSSKTALARLIQLIIPKKMSCDWANAPLIYSTTLLRAILCGPCTTSLNLAGIMSRATTRAGSRTRVQLPKSFFSEVLNSISFPTK